MAHLHQDARTKLEEVRREISKSNLDAIIISKNDPHLLEYGPERENGIFFLSGFDGSAGLAAVTMNNAAVFTDGRYTLQLKDQVDSSQFNCEELNRENIVRWLKENLPQGGRVGIALSKFNMFEAETYEKLLKAKDLKLEVCDDDLTLKIWQDRFEREPYQICSHDLSYAGKSAQAKLEDLCATMNKHKADACFLNSLESVSWLFNIRAPKRMPTPVPDAFAFVSQKGKADLFLDAENIESACLKELQEFANIHDYQSPRTVLKKKLKGQKVILDPTQNTLADLRLCQNNGAEVIRMQDPTLLFRAIKNATEIKGAQEAHRIDSRAVIKTLAWLDGIFRHPHGNPSYKGESIRELDVINYLAEARQRAPECLGASFDTIAGAGPNGAIVHYRATTKTNRTLKENDMFLLDSGGQYFHGTTDITRTIFLGNEAPQELKKHYTLVLKGHLALKRQLFPKGTSGLALDGIARQYLWNEGLNYAHGTGHGVGSFMGVHEGPQRISPAGSNQPLIAGMILSNEPGFYKNKAYGIRIENLMYVLDKKLNDNESYLGFENLTLVPYDRILIDVNILSDQEIQEIDLYHQKVQEVVARDLEQDLRDWLQNACRPIR